MAKLNRADIIAQIDLLIEDNNTKNITALDVRTVLKTISESDYNLIDDDALEVFYDPTEDLDWDAVIPTEVMAALDQLAKRLRIAESSLPIVYESEFYINSDDTISGLKTFRGLIYIDLASEELSGNLTSAFYEVSLDGITFTTVGGTDTLSDLDTWIILNITTQPFYIRAYGVYANNEEELATINFQYTK
jgi:hypothetical protein